MYIHYSPDGDYRAISNFRTKSLRSFLHNYRFIHINCEAVTFENITVLNNIDVAFNYESFMYLINLDCENCPKQQECNKLFPLDILLNLDGQFQVVDMIVFVDGTLTRLINYYGRYGHFFHCIDKDLLNNEWYKHKEEQQLDKSKAFLNEEYYYAIVELKKRFVPIFGEDTYNKLRAKLVELASFNLSKSKQLFEVNKHVDLL